MYTPTPEQIRRFPFAVSASRISADTEVVIGLRMAAHIKAEQKGHGLIPGNIPPTLADDRGKVAKARQDAVSRAILAAVEPDATYTVRDAVAFSGANADITRKAIYSLIESHNLTAIRTGSVFTFALLTREDGSKSVRKSTPKANV